MWELNCTLFILENALINQALLSIESMHPVEVCVCVRVCVNTKNK